METFPEPQPPEQAIEDIFRPEDDYSRLASFVADVLIWVDVLVQARYVLFHHQMRGHISNGLGQVQENGDPSERVYDCDVESLEAHGLLGDSLDMKLMGYIRARNRFWRRAGLRHLKWLLGWIKSILSSLASVEPTLGAINELVDIIERAVDETFAVSLS